MGRVPNVRVGLYSCYWPTNVLSFATEKKNNRTTMFRVCGKLWFIENRAF